VRLVVRIGCGLNWLRIMSVMGGYSSCSKFLGSAAT
jgi:hypothetical protein